MGIQPLRSLVGVYVKSKLGQSRNRRAVELATECDNEPVIAERAQLVRRRISNMNYLIGASIVITSPSTRSTAIKLRTSSK